MCIYAHTVHVLVIEVLMSPSAGLHNDFDINRTFPRRNVYRLNQIKIPQHKTHDISEMREYFCTKFCSFANNTFVQKYVALLCVALFTSHTPN